MGSLTYKLGYGVDGSIEVAESAFTIIRQVVGTSSVQLSSTTAFRGVLVKAHVGNAGIIYVDNNNPATSTTGFELAGGDSIFIPVDNANKIFLISNMTSQKVSVLVI